MDTKLISNNFYNCLTRYCFFASLVQPGFSCFFMIVNSASLVNCWSDKTRNFDMCIVLFITIFWFSIHWTINQLIKKVTVRRFGNEHNHWLQPYSFLWQSNTPWPEVFWVFTTWTVEKLKQSDKTQLYNK